MDSAPLLFEYRLTRGALEALAAAGTPVGLVTKGPMVVRDIDVLQAYGAHARCRVYLSVPTVDDEAWRVLEPGTAPPMQRLRAARALLDAGVDTAVLMAPLVPGLSTARVQEAVALAKARYGIGAVMRTRTADASARP